MSYSLPLSLVPYSGPFNVTAGFGTLDQPTDALEAMISVPEPTTAALLSFGVLLLGYRLRGLSLARQRRRELAR